MKMEKFVNSRRKAPFKKAVICILVLMFTQVFSLTWAQSPDNLVGNWKLDETDGDIAFDSSENAFHSTLKGNVQWEEDLEQGQVLSAANEGFVECENSEGLDIGTSDLTITAWIKTDKQTDIIPIVAKGAEWEKSEGYTFLYDTKHGTLEFWISDGTKRIHPTTSYRNDLELNDNKWHFVAVTLERKEGQNDIITFYVDGILIRTYDSQEEDLVENADISNSARNLTIGYWNNIYAQGSFDEVSIYKVALDEEKIRTIMIQRLNPTGVRNSVVSVDSDYSNYNEYNLDIYGTATSTFWKHNYFNSNTHTGLDYHLGNDEDHVDVPLHGFGKVIGITDSYNGVTVQHLMENGEYINVNLMHLYRDSIVVEVNDYVAKYQIIGREGNEGLEKDNEVTAAHLHFEIAGQIFSGWVKTDYAIGPVDDDDDNDNNDNDRTEDYDIGDLKAYYQADTETQSESKWEIPYKGKVWYNPEVFVNNHKEMLIFLSRDSVVGANDYDVYGVAGKSLYGYTPANGTFDSIGIYSKNSFARNQANNTTEATALAEKTEAKITSLTGVLNTYTAGDYIFYPVANVDDEERYGYPTKFSVLENNNSVIVDNDQINNENYSYTTTTDTEEISTVPGYFLTAQLEKGGSNVSSEWKPGKRGTYKIYAYIPEGSTATSVVYTINADGNTETLSQPINQSTNGWVQIRTIDEEIFEFDENGSISLSLSEDENSENHSVTETQKVSFDAIKFVSDSVSDDPDDPNGPDDPDDPNGPIDQETHGLNITDYFGGNWTKDGTEDLLVRTDKGDMFLFPFGLYADPIKVGHNFHIYTNFTVIDYNHDGISDLIVKTKEGKSLLFLFKNGTFYGKDGGVVIDDGPNDPTDQKTHDLNITHYFGGNWTKDGTEDLLVRTDEGDMFLFPFGLSGDFIKVGQNFNNYTNFTVIDYNNNGISDLVVKTKEGKSLVFYFKNNTFSGGTVIDDDPPVNVPPETDHDFKITHYFFGKWSGYRDEWLQLMVRTDNGDMLYYPCGLDWDYDKVGSGFNYTHYKVMDYDGDGRNDLIVKTKEGKLLLFRFGLWKFDSGKEVEFDYEIDFDESEYTEPPDPALKTYRTYSPSTFIYPSVKNKYIRFYYGTWSKSNSVKNVIKRYAYKGGFYSYPTGDMMGLTHDGEMHWFPDGDFNGQGIKVGHGFHFTHYLVMDYDGDGISDFLVRNKEGQVFFIPFRNNSFYGDNGDQEVEGQEVVGDYEALDSWKIALDIWKLGKDQVYWHWVDVEHACNREVPGTLYRYNENKWFDKEHKCGSKILWVGKRHMCNRLHQKTVKEWAWINKAHTCNWIKRKPGECGGDWEPHQYWGQRDKTVTVKDWVDTSADFNCTGTGWEHKQKVIGTATIADHCGGKEAPHQGHVEPYTGMVWKNTNEGECVKKGEPHQKKVLLIKYNFDLNGDKTVNEQDVIMCMDIILGTTSGNGDVNRDGVTDILDVTALKNEILGN